MRTTTAMIVAAAGMSITHAAPIIPGEIKIGLPSVNIGKPSISVDKRQLPDLNSLLPETDVTISLPFVPPGINLPVKRQIPSDLNALLPEIDATLDTTISLPFIPPGVNLPFKRDADPQRSRGRVIGNIAEGIAGGIGVIADGAVIGGAVQRRGLTVVDANGDEVRAATQKRQENAVSNEAFLNAAVELLNRNQAQ